MNFSSSNLALVAYAAVLGSDGSMSCSGGFASSTRVTTGTYQLFLSTALAQSTTTGAAPDLISVTPGKSSSGSLVSQSCAAAQSNSTMVSVVTNGSDTDFSLMVWRTVVPPA